MRAKPEFPADTEPVACKAGDVVEVESWSDRPNRFVKLTHVTKQGLKYGRTLNKDGKLSKKGVARVRGRAIRVERAKK